MNTHSNSLLAQRTGAVLCLTLNRPQARNALNLDLTRALVAALREFDEDAAVRVLVVTGADPAFCAGLDLKSFADPASPRSEVGDRKSTRLNSSHVEISYAVFCLKKKKKPL